MTEPTRFLSGYSNDFERDLLEAARSEEPPDDVETRMLRVLGAPVSELPGAPQIVGKPPLALSTGAIASLGALGLAALLYFGRTPDSAQVSATRIERAAPISRNYAPKVASLRVRKISLSKNPSQKSAGLLAQTSADSLRDELRLLDQARNALLRGDKTSARSILTRYGERYPRGQLGVEATKLRTAAKD